MSIIPLDVQRRCERRWAARFFPADGNRSTSKPTTGEGEPADRRARQEQKKSPPGSSGGLETFIGGVRRGPGARCPCRKLNRA